jgi:hypothetical protein
VWTRDKRFGARHAKHEYNVPQKSFVLFRDHGQWHAS